MVHDGSDVPERRRTPRWRYPRGGGVARRPSERASLGIRRTAAGIRGRGRRQRPSQAETARFRSRQSPAALPVRRGGRSLLT